MNVLLKSTALVGISLVCSSGLFAAEESRQSAALEPALFKGLSFSGLLEVEGAYGESDGESSSDLSLATVELGLEAKVTDWLSARILLLYEQNGDDRILVDEASIRVQRDDSPFFVQAGRFTQSFGNFATGMISDPITLELGETKHHASLQAGYEGEIVSASFSLFKGDVQKEGMDEVNSFVGALSIGGEVNERFRYELGGSYCSNMADTDGLQDDFEPDLYRTDDYVGGYSVYGLLGFGSVEVRAEYLAAAESFVDGDRSGLKPAAYNVEVGCDLPESLHLALRYAGAEDFNVEKQYGATLACDLSEKATLALEYLHNSNDDATSSDAVTVQLAMSF
ncbi:MAG: LbtU family siderophore porin [Chlorobiaceae bacterium]|jgi:hypothetical protein|nr:LbtU family siderophore porin [Chlorobiaceae bacterium]NTW63249.1 LbtU family siderophore porin [Chlorobiaceae bacterium]